MNQLFCMKYRLTLDPKCRGVMSVDTEMTNGRPYSHESISHIAVSAIEQLGNTNFEVMFERSGFERPCIGAQKACKDNGTPK